MSMMRWIAPFLLVICLLGCASTMPADTREKLDGLILYGWVNRVSPEVVHSALKSETGKRLCSLRTYSWCEHPDRYTYVSVMFMNTYWGGLKGVAVYAPVKEDIKTNDIVVVRFGSNRFSELIRIASRGEKPGCSWVGGGLSRTTTAAGVVCEDYDWRTIQALFGN